MAAFFENVSAMKPDAFLNLGDSMGLGTKISFSTELSLEL